MFVQEVEGSCQLNNQVSVITQKTLGLGLFYPITSVSGYVGVLKKEATTSYMLGKCSASELHPSLLVQF